MKKQNGFTLIELIMVIVILGILSAFALPRFADLSGNAEQASLDGGTAAVKSAAAIVHAYCLANDCSGGSVTLEGQAITVTGANGYPTNDAAGIMQAANLSGFTFNTTTSVIALDSNTACEITYVEASGSASDDDCAA